VKITKLHLLAFLLPFTILGLTSCFSVKYSASGANISPDVKSISVQFFPNRATLVNPQLSQLFTEALRDKMRTQTSKIIRNEGGDVDFEGEIVSYDTRAMAITSAEAPAQNRLTITVKVRFTDNINPAQSFEQTFSRYSDYDSSKDFSSVESTLVTEILDLLTEDIFNKAFVNW
jgi:hypothetical protein